MYETEALRGSKVRTYTSGTLARAICNTVNSKHHLEPIDVGKPSPILVHHLRRPAESGGLGIDLSKAVVIGDCLETDIQLAIKGGMKSLMVLSGVTDASTLQSQDASKRPTWTAETFADTY